MKFYYLTFRSVTFAQRGEKLLRQKGIRCTLLRTPRWMEEQGCGYSLRLWTEEVGEGVRHLRESGIPLRKVYRQVSDGTLEEVAL